MNLSEKGYTSAIRWNLLSTVFSGICGLIVLVMIGGVYGPEALGSFNQVYAFYIVFSQFGAFGIQLSLVKHLAEYDRDDTLCSVIFSSGVSLALFFALFWALFLFFVRGMISAIFSQQVGYGVGIVSAGVFFFSLNKAMMFSLNGMSLLKEYALFQALRFLFMLAILISLIILHIDAKCLSLVLSLAEGVLFLSLLVFFRRSFNFQRAQLGELFVWGRRHFFFGLKSFGGHILVLLNTRIDVLCLGLMTNDRTVGIYSMAAIVAESVSQVPAVFRTVYTPDIVKFVAERRMQALTVLVRRGRVFLSLIMFFIAVAAYFCIDLLLPALTGKLEYMESAILFAILMLGIVFAAGYMPFSFILISGGYPGVQSIMILLVVAINIVGNISLIPIWGGVGAVLATSLANISSVYILKKLTKKYLDFEL
jgi:O-antigen/teichoic acid export membrane protein